MICFKPKALKTSPNFMLQQVSIIYFRYEPVFSNSGIKDRDDVLCALILIKEIESFFFLDNSFSVISVQIWYGWKYLVESFPTHIFGVAIEL